MNFIFDGTYYNISARDSQRAKVYAAEREAFGDRMHQKDKVPLPDMQRRCNEITRSATWEKLRSRAGRIWKPDFRVTLKPGYWCRRATASGLVVKLPLWSRNELVLLHELAHVAVGTGSIGHHWPFAATYLDLVSRFSSPEDAALLRAAFKKYRVRWHAPRRMDPARLQILRERGRAALLAWRQQQRAAKEQGQ